MAIHNVEGAMGDIRQDRMVILVDDRDRENGGDITIAAGYVAPKAINFVAKYTRGPIHLPFGSSLVDKLDLPLMTQRNDFKFGTDFAVSIKACNGVITDIPTADHARAILTTVADDVRSEGLVTSGHVFPLHAQLDSMLTRAGRTEGSMDLTVLAGLKPAAIICEIMKDDGTMARMSGLEKFVGEHNLKIAAMRGLIRYHLRHGQLGVHRVAETRLPSRYDNFTMVAYEDDIGADTHVVIVKDDVSEKGDPGPVLIHIHSKRLIGNASGSLYCGCSNQFATALTHIGKEGWDAAIYVRQEGRNIGLANKLRAYILQDQGYDTAKANEELGFRADLRDYDVGTQIFLDLDVRELRIMTNNPRKTVGLEGYGIEIVGRRPIEVGCCATSEEYVYTKQEKMGHMLRIPDDRK